MFRFARVACCDPLQLSSPVAGSQRKARRGGCSSGCIGGSSSGCSSGCIGGCIGGYTRCWANSHVLDGRKVTLPLEGPFFLMIAFSNRDLTAVACATAGL